MGEHWNCHDHREELMISDNCSIYHPEHGQLGYTESHYDCILFFPIIFKNKAAAARWIEKGTIAEIQESLSHLGVGLSTISYKGRMEESDED